MLTTVAWILGFVLGLAGLFVLICLPHNVRIWRVRRVYRSLPTEVVDQVLQLLEQAAARGRSVTFLRLAEEVAWTDAQSPALPLLSMLDFRNKISVQVFIQVICIETIQHHLYNNVSIQEVQDCLSNGFFSDVFDVFPVHIFR